MRAKDCPPAAASFDRASLVAIAQKEGIDVQFADAEIHFGWDTVVLSTVDGWILRFPRSERLDTAREQRLLEALAAELEVEIPSIEYLGSNVSLEVYRRINGHHLSLERYGMATRQQQRRVAASVARPLQQFHALDIAALAAKLQLRPSDPGHLLDPIRQKWHLIPDSIHSPLAVLIARFEERWCRDTSLTNVLHSDFHFDNMSFSAPCGVMTGLWDFSCVELGEPSYDFRYLSVDAPDFCLDVIDAYEAATGIHVDFEGAKLAGTIEAISDDLVVRGAVDESLLSSNNGRFSSR